MRQFLEGMTGLAIYPLISFCIFIVFFVGLLIYVVSLRKQTVNEVKNIPFDNYYHQSNEQ